MLKEAVDRSQIELAALSSTQPIEYSTVSTVSSVTNGPNGSNGLNGPNGSNGSNGTTVSPVSTNEAKRKRFEQSLRQKSRDLISASRTIAKSICQLSDSFRDQQTLVFYVPHPSNSLEIVVSSLLLSTFVGSGHRKSHRSLQFRHSSIPKSPSKYETSLYERHPHPYYVSMQCTHRHSLSIKRSIAA